jgi:hypothetical protein
VKYGANERSASLSAGSSPTVFKTWFI